MGVLIDSRRQIEDEWRRLETVATDLPRDQPVIVAAGLLRRDGDALLASPRRTGVDLPASEPVETIARFLPRIELVVLNFDVFADGRAFSQARLLRERYRYDGLLRARGDVVRDLLTFMRRCGIEQFELAPGEDVALALSALQGTGATYQPEPGVRVR